MLAPEPASDGLRSARVRRASVQLKPSPRGRQAGLDGFLFLGRVILSELAEGAEDGDAVWFVLGGLMPATGRDEEDEVGDEGYIPVLPRTSRSACAPKDMRRARGDGVGSDADGGSSPASSLLALDERLPPPVAARGPNDVCVGDVPDRPSVVIDKRRWLDCALAAAVAMGLGNGGLAAGGYADGGLPAPPVDRNISEKEPAVNDGRRGWDEVEETESLRSPDMMILERD